MNKEFMDLWKRAQQAWLEGCINAYGRLLNGAEELVKLNKQYHDKIQELVKTQKDRGSEDK